MKTKKILLLLTLGSLTISMSGCFFFRKTNLTELDKANVTYSYKDYTARNVFDIDSTPLTGSPKLLVIPVWFTDSSEYVNNKYQVREDIEDAYFGSPETTGWNSVSSYYQTLSNGKVNITGTVADWYECGQSASYYAYSETTTVQLVKDATNYYFSHTNDSRRDYDYDGNGYLDGVMLIYAAPDYQSYAIGSNLWAYCYWVQTLSPNVNNPQPNTFFWASYDFMYGNGDGEKYHNGETSHSRIDTHTFIHEMGHAFGLQDYYDYSSQTSPAGGFSMQDYNVGSHDPYSALALGWADALIPTESCTVKLSSFQDSHQVILLKNSSFNGSPFDEYLLLEYYTPTGLNQFDTKYGYKFGYPRGVDSVGVRLWHIDARLIRITDVNNASTYKVTNTFEDGYGYYHAFSNTRYSSSSADHASPLGPSYSSHNILYLVRNSKTMTYSTSKAFNKDDLFKKGDSFDASTFKKQFPKGTKFDNGEEINWSFSVKKTTSNEVIIKLTKKK